MKLCLACARRIISDPRVKPCRSCVADVARDPRAEIRAAVERFAEEWEESKPALHLSGLPVAENPRVTLTAEERMARGAAYMRDYRRNLDRRRVERAAAKEKGR